MNPRDYEAWYHSPRGRWVGAAEYALLRSLLDPMPHASLLDAGSGTGHFTRLFARDGDGLVVGIDPNREWQSYACLHPEKGERYVTARAEALPFPDRSFDCVVSVTALCFIRDQERALRELIRVTRKRFAIGLLNRHSLLYLEKGRGGGTGGYHGAHWHTAAEVRALFAPLPVSGLALRTAIVLPHGGSFARALDAHWPQAALWGGFLAVAGDIPEQAPSAAQAALGDPPQRL